MHVSTSLYNEDALIDAVHQETTLDSQQLSWRISACSYYMM